MNEYKKQTKSLDVSYKLHPFLFHTQFIHLKIEDIHLRFID